MSFVSLSKLKEKYTAGLMKDNIENLEDFDAFHCLLSGSMSSSLKVQELFGTTSQQFMDWIKVCDGGLLFDTVMLSTKEYDKDLFDEYNKKYDNGFVASSKDFNELMQKPNDWGNTRYEQKALQKGKNCYYMTIKRM